jgi:hypothetical protein
MRTIPGQGPRFLTALGRNDAQALRAVDERFDGRIARATARSNRFRFQRVVIYLAPLGRRGAAGPDAPAPEVTLEASDIMASLQSWQAPGSTARKCFCSASTGWAQNLGLVYATWCMQDVRGDHWTG